jgi:hypothetical protein
MLTNYGEFIPFGATMKPDGKEAMVGGGTGEEHPKSRDVIDLLQQSYRAQGAEGKIICSALAYDIRVVAPGTSTKTDAVAIDLDHRDGMSVTVFYPYTISADKKVVIGESWATVGDNATFENRKNG